jgi:predicted amidohydrolase
MGLAAIQMNSGADVATNLEQLEQLLKKAQQQGAGLAVLPENFALMSENRQARLDLAEQDGAGLVQDRLAQLAADLDIWLVAGTLPILSNDPQRPCSACCVYNNNGERVARYDKIHLFDVQVPDVANDDNQVGSKEVYRESSFTLAGAETLVVDTPWGSLGVAVCYDLRFPELFRQMLATGLDLLAVPAAFTVATGRAHWELLLRARAVENLSYVVAAAQVGEHPGNRETWGHSMIVDPWGLVLADAGATPGLVVADMEREKQQRLRREFPVLEHRRDRVN